MSRPVLLAVPALLLGAAAATWWVWSAPPRAWGTDLATAVGWTPPTADGVLVVAQAPRLTRWLARRPAAAFFALAVVPEAHAALRPLWLTVPPLVRTARGPLAAWWGKSGSGFSGTVSPTDVAGLRQLAALQGLGWAEERMEGDLVRVWIFSGAPPSRDVPSGYSQPPAEGSWSALTRVGDRWWRLRLVRAGLTAESGVPLSLPECRGETIVVSTRLARLLTGDTGPTVPASALLVTPDGGWAGRLGGASGNPIERMLRALAGRSPSPGDPPVTSWESPFGRFYLSRRPALTIATDPALMGRLPAPLAGSEWGCLRGKEVVRALAGALPLLDRLPGMPSHSQLDQASKHLRRVEWCAWKVEAGGGRFALQW